MSYIIDIEQALKNIVDDCLKHKNILGNKKSSINLIQVQPSDPVSVNSGIEYHFFAKNAYNRTRTKHLIDRGESLLAALIEALAARLPATQALIKQLEYEREQLNYFVKKSKVKVPFNKSAVLALDIDFEYSQRKLTLIEKDIYIKAVLKVTDDYISQMLQRMVVSIKRSDETYFSALQRLRDIEISYHAHKGRPTYISHFTVPEHPILLQKPLTLVSMQKPIGYYTDSQWCKIQQQGVAPASREYTHTSKYRHVEGIANFVESAWGHFEPTTQEFRVTGSLLRGSWIPIAIKDAIQRRAMGLRALEQEFEYLANTLIAKASAVENAQRIANNCKENPWIIPLSSMSLLSLLGRLDILDPDHQFRIAQDNHLIIGMANSEPFTVTLATGQTLYVKADINALVMGVNAQRYEKVAHPLQAEINHRGFNHWLATVYHALLAQTLHLEDSPAVQQIRDLIRQDGLSSELKHEILLAEEKINSWYLSLKQVQYCYENEATNLAQQQQYQILLQKIRTAETALDKLQQRLLAQRNKQWQQLNANREQAIIKLQQEYKALAATDVNTQEKKSKLGDLLEVIKLLSDAETLFYTKRYYAKDPKDNYAFQTRYIIINQYLKRNPHVSCKSSEDRTGELENRVMEMQALKAIQGGYPRLPMSQQARALSQHLGRYIHEFAASTKNTEYNAQGAGGLQLHDHASWWQKLVFGGKGDGNGYKYHKEALMLAKREKVFFKESVITKLLGTILPFITPKAKAMTWGMWFDDVKMKIQRILSRQKKTTFDEPPVKLHCHQEVPTAKQFEDALHKALNGKKLNGEYQGKVAYLSRSLDEYHQFITSAHGKQIDLAIYWDKLLDLRASFGNCLLPLCNEEAGLRMDKQQTERYEQIFSIIVAVEKVFHKVTHLKNQLEKEMNLLGKTENSPQPSYHKVLIDAANKTSKLNKVLDEQYKYRRQEKSGMYSSASSSVKNPF